MVSEYCTILYVIHPQLGEEGNVQSDSVSTGPGQSHSFGVCTLFGRAFGYGFLLQGTVIQGTTAYRFVMPLVDSDALSC